MSLRDPNVVNPKRRKRVAIVISNPAVSSTTGWPVGFWWSELTHPYFRFTEEGYDVEVFSAAGGKCEADAMSDPRDASGYSSSDLISMGFIATPSLAALVENTKPAAQIDVDRFDAIVVAGGQAPMFTYERAVDLQKKFVEFYAAGKIASALCHGVAILRYAKLGNGEHLAKGKTVTRLLLPSKARLMRLRPSTAASTSASLALITGSRAVFWLQPATRVLRDSG